MIHLPDNCANCSYSLHGLSPKGRCPECGSAYDKLLPISRVPHYRASLTISAINICIILFVFFAPYRPMPDLIEFGGLFFAWVLSLGALACAVVKRPQTRTYNLLHAMLALALSIVILVFLSFFIAIAMLFFMTGGA